MDSWIHQSFRNATNNQMELIALHEGLKICEAHNFSPLDINMDSMKNIKTLNNSNLLYNGISHDCISKLKRLVCLVVSHNYREKNRVEGVLAKYGADAAIF